MDVDSRLIFESYITINEAVTDEQLNNARGGILKVNIKGSERQFKISKVKQTPIISGSPEWSIEGHPLNDYSDLAEKSGASLITTVSVKIIHDPDSTFSILYNNDPETNLAIKDTNYADWKNNIEIVMPAGGGGGDPTSKKKDDKYEDPTWKQKIGNMFLRSPLKVAAYVFKDPETNFKSIKDASAWLQKVADAEAKGSKIEDRRPEADIIY
jgi:hypothetical protein